MSLNMSLTLDPGAGIIPRYSSLLTLPDWALVTPAGDGYSENYYPSVNDGISSDTPRTNEKSFALRIFAGKSVQNGVQGLDPTAVNTLLCNIRYPAGIAF